MPTWTKALRKYQLEGAQWLAFPPRKMRGRILADGLGFGKSRTALGAARIKIESGSLSNISSKCILVFCPTIARSDWIREAAAVWPELPIVTVGWNEPRVKRKSEAREQFEVRRNAGIVEALNCSTPTLLICSHESAFRVAEIVLAGNLLLGHIIVDEAHVLKKSHVQKVKMIRPLVARAELISLLTGTPIHNKPEDLHELLDICSLGRFGSKWTFASKYFRIEANMYGRRIAELLDKQGLHDAVSDYVLCRSVREAYGELPSCIRKVVKVKPSGVLPKMTREQLRKMFDASASGAIGGMLRKCAKVKLEAAADLVKSLDEPVVCYTFEREHASELANLLAKSGISTVVATGLTEAKKRAALIESWKAGAATALVCTMDAVRESATLTRAAAMIFVDIDWLPGKQLQCEGRIDPARQPEGDRRPARYYYIVTDGGPDEVIAERVVEKIVEMQGIITMDDKLVSYEGMLKDIGAVKQVGVDLIADLVERLISHSERMEKVGGGELLDFVGPDTRELEL